MERDGTSLLDVLAAAKLVQEFTQGMTRDQFNEDIKCQAAVMREIEIIGEATKRISEEFRLAKPPAGRSSFMKR